MAPRVVHVFSVRFCLSKSRKERAARSKIRVNACGRRWVLAMAVLTPLRDRHLRWRSAPISARVGWRCGGMGLRLRTGQCAVTRIARDKRQQPAGLSPLADVVCNESGAARAHRSCGEWLEGH
ncbi:Hypothetical Protein RRSL_02938 [Ralstonia solanacearum UW551]|uniref:Uncharacterized protein n=1 Tax=Ralstonia solanacearum (strain UW551) TaxID=342110 RepID=A0AB33VEF2_RALSU|nr:Hypothetical Protein RRSL_02938 [Ralstonia solanacearum UW551]